VTDEALQRLDAEGELAEGEGPLGGQPSRAEVLNLLGARVLGATGDSLVLATAAFHGGLHKATTPAGDQLEGFTTMSSPVTPKRGRAASWSRQTTTAAREPRCRSWQTTVGMPWCG